MRKLLYVLVGILLAAFILPSCNSSLSITKRRYNKGYFVQHNHGRQHVKKQTQTALARPVETKEVEPVRATAFVTQKSDPAETVASPKPVTASAAKGQIAALKKDPAKARSEVISLAVKKPVKAIKLATNLAKSADAGDDALSLLWVVIVVILIVYLLGILMDGFGLPSGLIHILGVIALVLLILWLLRIL